MHVYYSSDCVSSDLFPVFSLADDLIYLLMRYLPMTRM